MNTFRVNEIAGFGSQEFATRKSPDNIVITPTKWNHTICSPSEATASDTEKSGPR